METMMDNPCGRINTFCHFPVFFFQGKRIVHMMLNQTYWREKQRSEYNADGDRIRPQITHTYMRRGKNKSYLSVFYLFLGIESVNLGSYCLFYFGSMFISSLETLLLANKY